MTHDSSPPAEPSYQRGDLIAGKYELEELLGRGGMGSVWRAQNVALDAAVAIKILSATADHAALRERLRLEAKVAASVTHPAIVKVFDVGETERGDPFIVMELLNGTSLGNILLAERRLPATRAVQTLLPIAEALQLAHGRGLVHRDVKPDNIFIVHDESSIQPKLVDFGIVKITQQDGNTHLTRAGDVLGSPDYLSPEQARGQSDVDHLSDVWAFSVVLFEAIAGRVPFDASNYNALVRQIIEDEPPALRELAAVDEQLSAIVARGLSKERSERYGSMAELGRALARWLHEQGEQHDLCGTSLERKWLRASDPEELGVWQSEAGSRIRLVTRPQSAESLAAATHAAATSTSNRVGLRIAALALTAAGLGFGLVAWYNGAFAERGSVNGAATVHAAPLPQPQPQPQPQPAARSSPPPQPAAPENQATPATDVAPMSSAAPRRSRAVRPAPRRHAPPQVQAKPTPRSDLIKPYE